MQEKKFNVLFQKPPSVTYWQGHKPLQFTLQNQIQTCAFKIAIVFWPGYANVLYPSHMRWLVETQIQLMGTAISKVSPTGIKQFLVQLWTGVPFSFSGYKRTGYDLNHVMLSWTAGGPEIIPLSHTTQAASTPKDFLMEAAPTSTHHLLLLHSYIHTHAIQNTRLPHCTQSWQYLTLDQWLLIYIKIIFILPSQGKEMELFVTYSISRGHIHRVIGKCVQAHKSAYFRNTVICGLPDEKGNRKKCKRV